METHMLSMVRKAYGAPSVPRELNRRNQRALVRALRTLGDKWLFATRVQPIPPEQRKALRT